MSLRNLGSAKFTNTPHCVLTHQLDVQARPKHSYWILLKGLFCVYVCNWVLYNTLHSMSWMVSGFYIGPIVPFIFGTMCCVIFQIYIIIQCSCSLRKEYNLSLCCLSQLFGWCTSVILHLNVRWIASIACMSIAFHWFQSWQQYFSKWMTSETYRIYLVPGIFKYISLMKCESGCVALHYAKISD